MSAVLTQRLLLTCLALSLLASCVKMESPPSEPDSAPAAPHTNRALQPGDKDYPSVNPSPADIVEVTVVAPPSIPVELHLLYVVDAHPDEHDPRRWVTAPGCNWTEQARFHIEIVLPFTKSGDIYTASMARDHFQAGACGWKLWSVTSPIVRIPIVYFEHSYHTSAHPFPNLDLSRSENDFWCTQRTHQQSAAPANNVSDFDCTFASAAWSLRGRKWTPMPIPVSHSRWNNNATQYTKTMRIEFHDVDQLPLSD
jgi:hypothetical protein